MRAVFSLKSTCSIIQFLFLLGSCFLIGCGNSRQSSDTPSGVNQELSSLVQTLQLSGDPSKGRNLPSINDPKAQLGMKLFFTKALSGDKDTACVSCHHPVLGGGDDLSLPIGVDAVDPELLGPGRVHLVSGEHYDGGPTVPRNAPSTFNIALWDQVLFHDGRVESLGKTPLKNGDDGMGIRTPDSAFGEADPLAGQNMVTAQARFPVTSAEEMKNFGLFHGLSNAEVRTNLQQRLGDYGEPAGGFLVTNHWLDEFRAGFDEPQGSAETLITFNNVVDAIASYENSQVFVETPWKSYVEGDDDAISTEAKRGALIFFKSVADGGADCASCHSGDFFTDESFHVIGMPQIGRGKRDGENGTEDFGRFRETKNAADKYAFRTPSLLNVSATGPWGHAGAYTSLRATIVHHLNPQVALDNYDFTQIAPNIQANQMRVNTQKIIDQLNANRAAGLPSLQNVNLNEEQIDWLVEFLMSLTDPCVEDKSCLNQWIPSAEDTNPDTLRLNAMDDSGNYL
ncbi:cytochrome-c peroxidase [Aliikangiella maris]|uniref:Cytochrome c peroxidase n=2 Tax=Aliikangiella maris TaxID=3162458 RepID=A0ABV3MRI5_9GAMM